MSNFPFKETQVNESVFLRKFSRNTSQDDLIWHRDREDRIVEVISGKGWRFQRDNEVPIILNEGDVVKISANEYHRLVKGTNDLYLKVIKEKKDQNKDGKNDFKDVKIARMKASGMTQDQIKDKHPDLYEADLEEKRKRRKKKTRRKPTPGETKYRAQKYSAPKGSKRAKGMARAAAAYRRGDVKLAAKIRRNQEKKERKKKSFRNVPRSDTGVYTENLTELRELVNEMADEMIEFKKLEKMLEMVDQHEAEEDAIDEKRRRKKRKSSGGLSKAVKKSLDKKADRRCLTRGSVYAEFRKGLAAYLSSGSRKGMTAHQWAHARVNSANPSKSWASVKKRKKCPKKKK